MNLHIGREDVVNRLLTEELVLLEGQPLEDVVFRHAEDHESGRAVLLLEHAFVVELDCQVRNLCTLERVILPGVIDIVHQPREQHCQSVKAIQV